MVEAMAQASNALATYIHQAATWLGTLHSQSATPAQQRQPLFDACLLRS